MNAEWHRKVFILREKEKRKREREREKECVCEREGVCERGCVQISQQR